MIVQITGNIAVGLCDWIYDNVRKGMFNRAKLNKLLTLAMKYTTNNENDSKRWVYDLDGQTLKFYNGLFPNKQIWFKEQRCLNIQNKEVLSYGRKTNKEIYPISILP